MPVNFIIMLIQTQRHSPEFKKKYVFPAHITEFALPAMEMWGLFAVCTKFSPLTAHVRRAEDRNEGERSRPRMRVLLNV